MEWNGIEKNEDSLYVKRNQKNFIALNFSCVHVFLRHYEEMKNGLMIFNNSKK
jgi:hypothetical protein